MGGSPQNRWSAFARMGMVRRQTNIANTLIHPLPHSTILKHQNLGSRKNRNHVHVNRVCTSQSGCVKRRGQKELRVKGNTQVSYESTQEVGCGIPSSSHSTVRLHLFNKHWEADGSDTTVWARVVNSTSARRWQDGGLEILWLAYPLLQLVSRQIFNA